MIRPQVCLCLSAKSLAEDAALVEKYRPYIDMVELRVDFLEEDERLHIRDFPALVNIPCLLTIRRMIDGGQFKEGEAARTMLFARGLAFADQDTRKNFAYVDFEEDFHVPSLQDAALAFGTRIIRSFHDMNGPVTGIAQRFAAMRTTGYEIPKIACMPHRLSDVTELFREAALLEGNDQILCAMGPFGLPSRILAAKIHSFLTYTSPTETLGNLLAIGHIDPITLTNEYHFRSIDSATHIFGITGYPLKVTSSPQLHNRGYEKNRINAVYIPFCADQIDDSFEFAQQIDMQGFSVTIPHKEAVLARIQDADQRVNAIGACNTVVRKDGLWTGYNTDCSGFMKALCEFSGWKTLHHKKVAIIGAGGAARAVAYAIHALGGKACVFNRTLSKAREIAEKYSFDYAPLGAESHAKLEKYSDVIIQTTSKGMGPVSPNADENDPIFFYDFKGTELLYDIIYAPPVTPVMARAQLAGCKVSNGLSMLKYQGYEQFKLFTGSDYDDTQSK
jgi:3-dehydroquinate dehydratase / shikimate dehydrogenase